MTLHMRCRSLLRRSLLCPSLTLAPAAIFAATMDRGYSHAFHPRTFLLLCTSTAKNANWQEMDDKISGFKYYVKMGSNEFRWELRRMMTRRKTSWGARSRTGKTGSTSRMWWYWEALQEGARNWRVGRDARRPDQARILLEPGYHAGQVVPRPRHCSLHSTAQPKTDTDSETDEEEEQKHRGGKKVHDLLGFWGIPISCKDDCLERPGFYRLNVAQMKQLLAAWRDEEFPAEEFQAVMERAMGLRMPLDLERKVRVMERMFVPFFERDEMVHAMEQAMGNQDWDGVEGMVDAILRAAA